MASKDLDFDNEQPLLLAEGSEGYAKKFKEMNAQLARLEADLKMVIGENEQMERENAETELKIEHNDKSLRDQEHKIHKTLLSMNASADIASRLTNTNNLTEVIEGERQYGKVLKAQSARLNVIMDIDRPDETKTLQTHIEHKLNEIRLAEERMDLADKLNQRFVEEAERLDALSKADFAIFAHFIAEEDARKSRLCSQLNISTPNELQEINSSQPRCRKSENDL